METPQRDVTTEKTIDIPPKTTKKHAKNRSKATETTKTHQLAWVKVHKYTFIRLCSFNRPLWGTQMSPFVEIHLITKASIGLDVKKAQSRSANVFFFLSLVVWFYVFCRFLLFFMVFPSASSGLLHFFFGFEQLPRWLTKKTDHRWTFFRKREAG